jgi:polyphosphate glucokinase
MTPARMVQQVKAATAKWEYDVITIGYPGPVAHERPLTDPFNLGPGWVDFPYQKHFPGKPLKFLNDAAMQALGGYKGGRMLFLGTGTGLGSALIVDGTLVSLELSHMPYKNGKTYEDYLGLRGIEARGKRAWRKSVKKVIGILQTGMVADYVLLGGGNAKLMKKLPKGVILGANSNAIDGGIAIWKDGVVNPSKNPSPNQYPDATVTAKPN